MQKLLFLVISTLLIGCLCQNCPSVDQYSDDDCTECLGVANRTCYFGTVTFGGGNVRWCCLDDASDACAGVVSGGSKNVYTGTPRERCDCLRENENGGAMAFAPRIPPTDGLYGFRSYGVMGPGTFEAFPKSPGALVEIFAIPKAAGTRTPCAAYNSTDIGDPTIPIIKKGSFRQIMFPAGDYIVTVRTQSTGINDFSKDSVDVRYCPGGCATEVCGGTCDLNTQWCAFEGVCTSGDCGGQDMYYSCCPVGKSSSDPGCSSAMLLQVSFGLIVAIVALLI